MPTINILGTGTPGTAITKNATDVAQPSLTSANGSFIVNNLLQAADTSGSVKDLISTNSAVLVTNSSGTPTYSSSMTNGQLIIGSTGSTPTAANLVAGTNISITNGAGSITIAATSGGGTVNSGNAQQLAFYATTGTAVSGTSSINSDFAFNGVTVGAGFGTRNFNTCLGFQAVNNTAVAGTGNTGIGYQALNAVTTGANNTAVGSSAALNIATSSTQNVAVGSGALTVLPGTAISNCVAVGFQALGSAVLTGINNVAIGTQALRAAGSSAQNVAVGSFALTGNASTDGNVAIGFEALRTFGGALGGQNVFIGQAAGRNAGGVLTNNIGIGQNVLIALNSADFNHVISGTGMTSCSTGSNNSVFGYAAGVTAVSGAVAITTGSNNSLFGYQVSVNSASASGTIAIGAGSIGRASTGNTSADNGPGISFGSTGNPVGFRGDGSIYSGGTGRGYWRPNINGTAYLVPLFITGTTTVRASMVTDTNGSPILSSSMSDGQLIIGSSAGTPAAANLTQGTYITVTNAANSITIDTIGPVMTTSTITGTTQNALVNVRYITQNISATTITLPATCAVGDRITIVGGGGAAWVVQANTGQTVTFSTSSTSTGGTMTAKHSKDACTLICTSANTVWIVESYASDSKFNSFT